MTAKVRYLRAQVERDLSRKMVFLAGPRQVGKTTLAKSLPHARSGYLSWDVTRDRERILAERFPASPLWVFDEIHKFRRWRNYLKGVWDSRPEGQQLLVTGSARLDLYRFGGESLQGRYHLLRLHPLSVAELGLTSARDLDELLRLGGFPEPYFSGSVTEARRWSREYRARLVRDEIWDVPNATVTHKVSLTYDGNGQVSTVTDSTGKRRLLFAYTSNLLTSVQFQTFASSWTTQHTTSYAYASSLLSTVTIGGLLAQTNSYTSSYLTHIQDAAGKSIVQFAYTATAGQVARVDTTQGMIGFEYASGRAACTGKTVLHFNRGNTTSCNVDGDCGAGFLCGGKTGAGATGVCFRAAKCLTTSSPSDDVITGVAALGPPSESCTGACATVTQYLWNGTGSLDNYATQDAAGNYTTRTFDGNGMVTQITYGDPDSTPTNGNGARTEWRFYGDSNFPGKVTEIRRRSDLSTSASSCSSSNENGCVRTQFTYVPPGTNGGGKVATRTEIGYFGLDSNGAPVSHYGGHATTFSYDANGRLTQIDGPLSGSDDVTLFEYTGTGLAEHFLSKIRRKKDASNYLDQLAGDYDFWGNPTKLTDADGTLTCLTFSAARGTLTSRREAMAGQSTCTPGTGDLVTTWDRDSALRLVKLTRPDGSCLFYEYDSKGRLQRTKRRDDCNAGSAGDKQELVYDAEGLVTEIQVYDASNTLTAKQPFTYFDSRRLEKVINPVNASTWTGVVYDPRGLVQQVDAAGGLGKTVFERTGTPGAEGRVTDVKKYKTSSTFDTWSLIYSWLGEQTQVTDGDSKATQTVRDDLGRVVKLISPDMTYPVIRRYDAASRLYQVQERFGAGSDQRNHTFTFDHLGRPLTDDYAVSHSAGTCDGASNPPEVTRSYDAIPAGTSCPITGGCNHTAGRLAYVKIRLMCVPSLPNDKSLDQETFYSYDAAGRVVVEYIRDDSGRVAQQTFSWTPNGDLAQAVMPSTASIDWSYGSGGSNSDTDRVTAVSRNGTGNPVINAITWFPYGPLKQYNQQNTHGGVALRSRFTKNLAYRPDKQFLETQTGSTIVHQLTVSEDAKGRVTGRDFTSTVGGVRDSFYLYDDQDRVLCETTSVVSTCPTSGSSLKNNHSASPPFTNAGDWKRLLRPIPGSTGLLHEFNPFGYGSSHRIVSVNQGDGTPTRGYSQFTYYSDGDRSSEYLLAQSVATYRNFYYDNRHNLREVLGYISDGWTGTYFYTHTSGFDDRGRRVFKQMTWMGNTSSWFFYYDALDRLTEVRYTYNTASPANYTLFQLVWLDDRLIAYWQTDYPSATTAKRYVVTDETNRPVEMWSWPASGNGAAVWAIDPSAWGVDTEVTATYFQPILFAGQYKDSETTAYLNDGWTVHRPGLVLNGFRTYDPFTGSYLGFSYLHDIPDEKIGTHIASYGYNDGNPVKRVFSNGHHPRKRWQSYPSSRNLDADFVAYMTCEQSDFYWEALWIRIPIPSSPANATQIHEVEYYVNSPPPLSQVPPKPFLSDMPYLESFGSAQSVVPTLASVICSNDCRACGRWNCYIVSLPYAGETLVLPNGNLPTAPTTHESSTDCGGGGGGGGGGGHIPFR